MKWVVRLALISVLAIGVFAGKSGHTLAQSSSSTAPTQIKIFAPLAPDGTLNSKLQVRSRDTFPDLRCQAGSIATQRPDAWRCGTDDPCFAPAFTDPNDANPVLTCAVAPWDGTVQILTLQTPLPSVDECKASLHCREPLDLSTNPWAVELANGVRCRVFTGTITSIGGVGMIYGCANQDGSPAGLAGTAKQGLDRSQSQWQVFYQAPGDDVLQQVGVLVAWW
jgi:hypothetical protein